MMDLKPIVFILKTKCKYSKLPNKRWLFLGRVTARYYKMLLHRNSL